MLLQAISYKPAAAKATTASESASLQILDQLLLPHQTFYFAVETTEDAFSAIKKMQVRGAPAIAIVAALALAVQLNKELLSRKLPATAEETKGLIWRRLEYVKTSRPTAVNLGDAVGKLKIVADKAALAPNSTPDSVVSAYIAAAERMLVDDVADNKAIGEHGARWILEHTVPGKKRSSGEQQQLKVLTHCNTGSLATAGYGTALGVIRSLHSSHLLTHAFCTETRPYNQGSRLTAFELVHDQIPATLITDSMAASLLDRERANIGAIVVGADRVVANGDTANKIGTYSLAVLARHHGIKFLVAAPRTTIDLATLTGKDIVIEERPAEEVTRATGPKLASDGSLILGSHPETISTAAPGISVWNPAFDVTPADLIDGIITERGVVEKVGGVFDFRHLFDSE
ncbi:hypothetical protein DV735_g1173, partial [Chaetothyriales sp. CBS 134920]